VIVWFFPSLVKGMVGVLSESFWVSPSSIIGISDMDKLNYWVRWTAKEQIAEDKRKVKNSKHV
jgi:hypothetical protein